MLNLSQDDGQLQIRNHLHNNYWNKYKIWFQKFSTEKVKIGSSDWEWVSNVDNVLIDSKIAVTTFIQINVKLILYVFNMWKLCLQFWKCFQKVVKMGSINWELMTNSFGKQESEIIAMTSTQINVKTDVQFSKCFQKNGKNGFNQLIIVVKL